jgi:hypothetical protein
VVQIANAVFVSPIASLAVKAGLSWALSAGILDDHSFVEILVQLQGRLSLLHEFGRFGQVIFPRSFARSLSCEKK